MDSIKKLTDLFAKFPTIGQRTAGRFVFYLIQQPKEKVEELVRAIEELQQNINLCKFCFNPHESGQALCPICQHPSRNRQLLCLVEKETDLLSLENTKKYQGLYFILGGMNSRIEQLKERVKNPELFGLPKNAFLEIIIATNPTPEGISTAVLIERALKELPQSPPFNITRLAKGLPVGGELEYADEETLESAFEGRK
jgi:recombination protein RecR